MKLLYIIIIALIVCRRTTNALDVKHRLLIPPDDTEIVDDSYTAGGQSYNFSSGKAVKVNLNGTDLMGVNLKAPFIVTAIFKSSSKKVGLFRIRTSDENNVLGLVLTRINSNTSKVYLTTTRHIVFEIKESYENKWIKLVVYVRANGTAELYVNCNKEPYMQPTLNLRSTVLTKHMAINLAYYSSYFQFKGLIEEISLYTNADDDSLKYICHEEFPVGLVGPPGIPGSKGDKGDTGSKGEVGSVGPVGRQGLTGFTGVSGPRGFDGGKGSEGPAGKQGLKGSKGESGDRGSDGEKGSQGSEGQPGMYGVKGEKGDQGYSGLKGNEGNTGPRGEKGDMGQSGLKGSRGDYGPPGHYGAPGPRGYNGTAGPPGRDGLPASLTSLLDIENTAVVEKLRGFKGQTGTSGEKGTKGDQGLKGEPGLIGFKGDTGIRGLDGANGATGEPGASGAPGPKGPTGNEGLMGLKGEKGDRGIIPEIDLSMLKGGKGDRGLTGNPGEPGAVGLQGPPGICVVGPSEPTEQAGHLGKNTLLPSAATATTSFVPRTTQDFVVKHTLLQPSESSDGISIKDLVNDSYTPGLQSYKFTTGQPEEVDPKPTNLVGLNLSAPFIMTAIFKSYTSKPACLFSITQDKTSVMSLCLESARNISRVTLRSELFSPPDSISYLFNGNFKDKWIKIVMYVNADDKAALYVNCSHLHIDQPTLMKNKDVLLTKDMKLILAYTTSPGLKFEGLIEEISLYTNANDDTLLDVCNENPNYSSNYDKDGQAKEKQTQSLEYDFKKDLAECRREITVIKDGMNIQIGNITLLIRNEVREDIEDLQTMNEYLKEEFKYIENKNIDIENELKELKNKNVNIENELNTLKIQIQALTTVESDQKPSRNTRQTKKRK